MTEPNSPPTTSQTQSGRSRSIQLTPELVEKITAKVYALMLADARIARERRHYSHQKSCNSDGGH